MDTPFLQTPPVRQPSPCGVTVLVVDDEESVRWPVAEALRREGFLVLEAGHPEAALQVARDFPGTIDLLLTDVVMPGMIGPRLAARLVASRPGLRVLYMSGFSEEVVAAQLGRVAGTPLLEKPSTAEELVRRARSALERPPQATPSSAAPTSLTPDTAAADGVVSPGRPYLPGLRIRRGGADGGQDQ